MKNRVDDYLKLARHLDNLPGGFPPTDSGVELRILRRLFTPDQAQLALKVSLIPETSQVIAHRAGIKWQEAADRLAEMSRQGLILSLASQGKPIQYAAAQFVVGIWEFHVNNLDQELVRDFNEYMPALFREAWRVPQLRTIPVNQSIDCQLRVLPYERAEELARESDKALVAPCICRRERRIAGHGCDKPEESCLAFGLGAEYYHRNGLGRMIEKTELLEILARANEAGLVLQPANSQKAGFICCCCGCCCGVLRSIKLSARPASLVSSPFRATAKPESCNGCGICIDRCQMDALRLENGQVVLDRDRCIGCGLCVSTCPTESLALARKPEKDQPDVPKDGIDAILRLGRARGKARPADIAFMVIKSKVDRLLALR